MILYKYVYVGCDAGQYSTLTRTHTHIHSNMHEIYGPKLELMKSGFYPTHCRYFCEYPSGLGPIAILKFDVHVSNSLKK